MRRARAFRSEGIAPLALLLLSISGLWGPAFAQEAQSDTEAQAPANPSEPVVQTQGPADPATGTQRHGKFLGHFFDDDDGKLDFSEFLAKGGFIPMPIIITEPAVDGGFGLAAAFLSVSPENPRQVTKHIVGGFKTGNGSHGYGYFQAGYAFDGRLNYRFGIGRGEITLSAFPSFAPDGVEHTNHYNYGILGSALWHLADDRFSIGPLVDFRKLSSELDIAGVPQDFANHFNKTLHTGAIGLGLHFDSRNNPLTPTQGTNVYVEGKFNRDALGSDRNYEVYDLDAYTFDKMTSDLRYGVKVEVDAIRGDFPVFFAPSIDLRGVQAVQYQGMTVFNSEVEITWQLSPRWSLLAFGGVGATDAGNTRFFDNSGAIWAGGGGFRYRLARKLGFDAGVDFAYGPGGFVFYLQFGHAWSFGMD